MRLLNCSIQITFKLRGKPWSLGMITVVRNHSLTELEMSTLKPDIMNDDNEKVIKADVKAKEGSNIVPSNNFQASKVIFELITKLGYKP